MIEGAQDPTSQRRWDWVYDRWFGSQGYDQSAHTSKQWRLQMEPGYDGGGNRNVTARWFDYQDQIVDEYKGVIQGPSGMYNGPDLEGVHYTYDENGQKKSHTDQLGRVTDYTYDLRNRLKDTIEPKRADQAARPTTTTAYDLTGNKTDVTFPDTRSQHWRSYDAFGQPGQFIDERGNITDLNYTCGPMKKLGQVITHRSRDDGAMEDQPTSFYYDGLGRLHATVFPDQSSEWTFYLLGQADHSVTRKGQTKHIIYDVRGRETSNYWDNNAAPGVSRSWDDANRIVSLCNIYSKIKYEYDGAGQVRSETNTIAGSGGPVTTSYSRYPNGAVSRIVYPDTFSVRRDYNSRGQLSATGWSDFNNNWLAFASYHYRGDGKLEYQDYVNGVHTAFGYDDRGLLSQETISRGGQIYSQRTLYRDDRDRITAFRKSNNTAANPMENGRGDRFRYDEEGQLLEAWYNAADPVTSTAGYSRWDSFNYDALGNRRSWELLASKGWLNFSRKDNGLNQYHTWGSNPASYDDDIGGLWGAPANANGVLMQDGYVTAGYNALNQPIMMTTGAMGSNWMFFGYDPLGRCVKRWTGTLDMSASFPWTPAEWSNPATYFYYDGSSLIQEGISSSAVSQVYLLGNRVDEIVADYSPITGQWLYHHSDPRGHASMLTDSNGSLVEQYEYDAFGYPHCFSASNGWTQDLPYSSSGNRFLFTGREWLSELKLYDYRARMYQPELGRFMQPDPKQFAAGDYNLYRYCHNDPVNKSDPTGLKDNKVVERVVVREFTREVHVLGSNIPMHVTYTESGNWLNTKISDHYDSNLKSRTGKDGQTLGVGTVTQNGHDVHFDLNVNWSVDSHNANTDVVARELQHVSDFHAFSRAFADSLGPNKPLPNISTFGSKVTAAQEESRKNYDPDPIHSVLNRLHNTDPRYYPPKPFMLPTFENTNPYRPSMGEPPF